jgi:hypothetical protein
MFEAKYMARLHALAAEHGITDIDDPRLPAIVRKDLRASTISDEWGQWYAWHKIPPAAPRYRSWAGAAS